MSEVRLRNGYIVDYANDMIRALEKKHGPDYCEKFVFEIPDPNFSRLDYGLAAGINIYKTTRDILKTAFACCPRPCAKKGASARTFKHRQKAILHLKCSTFCMAGVFFPKTLNTTLKTHVERKMNRLPTWG